jgi:hypothetical protein
MFSYLYDIRNLLYTVLFVVPLIVWFRKIRQSRKHVDDITKRVLTAPDTIEDECKVICDAMNNAVILDSEKDCASQMRDILSSGFLTYETISKDPAVLLRTSRHFTSDNGALGTRFTGMLDLVLVCEYFCDIVMSSAVQSVCWVHPADGK